MKLPATFVLILSAASVATVAGQQPQSSAAPAHHATARPQSSGDAPARPQRTWQGPAAVRNQSPGYGNAAIRQMPAYTARQYRPANNFNPAVNRNTVVGPRYRSYDRPARADQPEMSPRVTQPVAATNPHQLAGATPRPQWADRQHDSTTRTGTWPGRNGGTGRDHNPTSRNWDGTGGNWNRHGGYNNGGGDFAGAYRRYHHEHHDRDWWRNHCSRIVFVNRGYYYWDAGWWYPAWGYDPTYSYYAYDGPIYGYDDRAPDEIITSVQEALRSEGYYFGAVDGELGPATRQALAAWQRDHGLAITTVIDEPTVQSLGI
jgi:hypothetical protein